MPGAQTTNIFYINMHELIIIINNSFIILTHDVGVLFVLVWFSLFFQCTLNTSYIIELICYFK